MSKITKSIEVMSSEDVAMGALVKLVRDVKAAVKVGGGAVPEATSIISACVADLAPALAQVSSLGSDAESDPVAAERAIASQLPDLVAAFRS